MSRAGFWLRGAKGKLAGSVLQKGEKGTIIRERVDPRNPQTTNQMRHRMAFGTCASAATWMLPVIGIAFEGNDNPKIGRRMFIQHNINALMGGIISSMRTGRTGVGLKGKGTTQLIPNPYIVSRGSLAQPAQFDFEGSGAISVQDLTAKLVIGDTYTAADLWNIIFGVKAGQQVTRVCIYTLNGNTHIEFPNVTDNTQDYMRYSRFFSDRLVLNAGEGNSITVAAATTAEQIENCMKSLIDEVATADTWFPDGIIESVSADTTELNVTVAAEYITPKHNDTKYKLQAFGCFISELVNNKWKFSTCQLACNEPGEISNEDTYYGLQIYNAIATYLKGNAAASELYTQQGGDDDLIGGDF